MEFGGGYIDFLGKGNRIYEKRLEEAVSQVLKQDYGKQHHVQELNRMVLIYSLQGREFVKWQLVD